MAKKSASSKNLDDLARMFMSILRFASNTEKACKMLKPKKSKKTYSKPRNSFPHYIHIAGHLYTKILNSIPLFSRYFDVELTLHYTIHHFLYKMK